MNLTYKNRHASGFTLLEMMVVVALSAILFGLIFGPLISAFNLTNRARTQIESQTAARQSMALIQHDLSDAAFVFDNAQTPLNLWLTDNTGKPSLYSTRFTMIEYVLPARQEDQTPYTLDPNTGARVPIPLDPTTGLPIYSSGTASGQNGFAVPIAPGRSLVRVFLGLQNNAATTDTVNPSPNTTSGMPQHTYGNPWTEAGQTYFKGDNRYMLYRAEVTVYVPDPEVQGSATAGPYVVDQRLFHTVTTPGGVVNPHNGTPIIHDSNFFYDSTPAGDPAMNPGTQMWAFPGATPTGPKGTYTIADNWRAAATPIITKDKADLVSVTRDTTGAITGVQPLVTLTPIYVQNDPGVPTSLDNTANEAPSPAPVTYQSQYTDWSEPFRLLVYRNPATSLTDASNTGIDGINSSFDTNQDPLSLSLLDYYQYVYITDTATYTIPQLNPDGSFQSIIVHNPGAMAGMGVAPGSTPQTQTQLQALTNVGPMADANGFWHNPALIPNNLMNLTNNFFAFTVDPQRGVVNFAFPSTALVNNGTTGLPCYYDPVNINDNLYNYNTSAYGPYQKRFLDLRAPLLNATATYTQLNQGALNTPLTIFTGYPASTSGKVQQIRIVPGSERVYGPDQRPGPNYGTRIQYTRVSANAGVVGPNEYKINYEDIPNSAGADANDPVTGNSNDPRAHAGYIEFDNQPDSASQPNAPTLYNDPPPNSLPLYKGSSVYTTGVAPGTPVNAASATPADPVEVTFNFQLNRSNDVVKIDYLTRTAINVVIEARLYEPSTGTMQVTDVTEKIKVRNLQH